MRFQTPQFIEVENKIFGPLTFKQFIYLIGGVGLGYVLYKILPGILGAPLGIISACFGGALAFYKFNNKPLINLVYAAFKYFTGQKLYIWKKPEPHLKIAEPTKEENLDAYVPRLSVSKLRDLAWSLDINENINKSAAADE